MILVGLILAVFGIAYIVSPWVREKVDGLKTYFFAVMAVLGQTLEAIDPNLLSMALGLDPRWKAGVMVALGVGIVWSRMVSAKPGPLAKGK
jgi:predicted membrane channel-forming protein YqfA (hemolysin III family)